MAEDVGGDKTEKATPKRRSDARKEGQVARSQEVNSALVLLGGGLAVMASTAWMGSGLRRVGTHFLEGIDTISVEGPQDAVGIIHLFFEQGAQLLAPVLLVTFTVGLVAAAGQVGWSFSGKALSFRWQKLNPIEGLKRMLGKHTLFELAKNLLKVSLLALVATLAIRGMVTHIAQLVLVPSLPAWGEVVGLARSLLLRLFGVLAVLALADWLWQRYRFEESIKMSKQEVKQELKDSEGDPQIKARLRSMMLDVARRRMMDDVKRADVVLTNPTHVSVAIKYDRSEPAPKVVAKGQGHLALRIREVAREAGVPVVEKPPLARALYKAVKVDQFIPTKLYEAVAQVLAAVYRAGRRKALGEV